MPRFGVSVPDVSGFTNDIAENVADFSNTKVADTVESGKAIVKDGRDTVSDKVSQATSAVGETLPGAMSGAINKTIDESKTMKDKTATAVSAMGSKITAIGSDIPDAIVDTLSKTGDKVKETAEGLTTGITTTVGSGLEKTGTFFRGAFSGPIEWLKQNKNLVIIAIAVVGGLFLIVYIGQIVTTINTVGRAVESSFKSGIKVIK
jgi:hypothetical protein